jgi:hypothetical protein
MPRLSKLNEQEVKALTEKKPAQSEREMVRQQYVDYLKNYNPGDWVSVDLEEGEKRQTVKNRLIAAAKQLGYQLNFIRTRGALKFEVQKQEK